MLHDSFFRLDSIKNRHDSRQQTQGNNYLPASLLDWRLKFKVCNLLQQENVTWAFAALLYSVQFVCIYKKQFRKASK